MAEAAHLAEFAASVRAGLSRSGQKELPPKYFYDELGSALFEAISMLPEYGLTRADQRLLQRHAGEISALMPLRLFVAELGSGSARKTRWILEALCRRQPTTAYFPVDIAASSLARCRQELHHIPGLKVLPVQMEYLDGLRQATAARSRGEHLLALFLGSTIGNFDRTAAQELLTAAREILASGDGLLLGTDLDKPAEQLIAAYDDPLGVTAAFNLNLLARINRELEGDFSLSRFQHLAHYNATERRVEMYLRATARQAVTIGRAQMTVRFEENETIWTENSHRFSPEEVIGMGRRAGFTCRAQWVDREWPFAETLLIAS